jgi:hypothetical protein
MSETWREERCFSKQRNENVAIREREREREGFTINSFFKEGRKQTTFSEWGGEKFFYYESLRSP